MVLLRLVVKVEDLVVLAEAVAVEVAVRVVEENALGIQVSERLVALDRLTEGSLALKREALLAQRITEAHPRPFLAGGDTPVALVNQDQVITLEGIHSDRLVAHFVLELVDVEDLHRLARE